MSNTQGAPWQIKFAYTFGIPAVIAVYLIWYQTNRIDKTIDQLQSSVSMLRENIKEMNATIINNRDLIINSERKYDRLINMMVRVCANAAETNIDRNACFEFAGTEGTVGNEEFKIDPDKRK